MEREYFFNQSKAFDPTAGCALNRIEAEQKRKRNKEAWLEIARKMCSKPQHLFVPVGELVVKA